MAVAATSAAEAAAPAAADRPDRPREGRAQARLDAVRARRARDAARRGLPDHLRVLALAAARGSALPGRRRVRRASPTTSPCCTSSTWWSDFGNTMFITVISVMLELVLGMLIAQAMYRAIFARTAIRASVLVPYGAVTVVAAFAWRLAFDPATGLRRQPVQPRPAAADHALGLDVRDHLRGGLEDDALHRPAAAGRSGARAGGPLQGGEDGRRDARGSAS